MFVIGNLFAGLAKLTDIILTVAYWLILIRALLSWVNPDPYNTIVIFLNNATEHILRPIRRILPFSGIDISPIIAFAVIVFLRVFLVSTLFDLSRSLR